MPAENTRNIPPYVKVMDLLRISCDFDHPHQATVRLEGKLLLDWIGELRHAYELAGRHSSRITFDMRGVSYIDTSSVFVLREWQRHGVTLADCSPWIRELLKETQ